MSVKEFGIKELRTPIALFWSLFGIRTVQAVSVFGNGFKIAIIGVPPWRALTSKDLFHKRCYEVK